VMYIYIRFAYIGKEGDWRVGLNLYGLADKQVYGIVSQFHKAS